MPGIRGLTLLLLLAACAFAKGSLGIFGAEDAVAAGVAAGSGALMSDPALEGLHSEEAEVSPSESAVPGRDCIESAEPGRS